MKAQRLSRRLQHFVDLIVAGGKTTAMDWLSTLGLMNMYQKHFNDDELDTLFACAPDTVAPRAPQWIEPINEFCQATQSAMPTGSDEAQTLAWRWIRLVIQMTCNNPELATKLMKMQISEPRVMLSAM